MVSGGAGVRDDAPGRRDMFTSGAAGAGSVGSGSPAFADKRAGAASDETRGSTAYAPIVERVCGAPIADLLFAGVGGPCLPPFEFGFLPVDF